MSSDAEDADAYASHAPVDVVLWLWIALGLGVVTMQLLTLSKGNFLRGVPYTVVMFLLGIVWSVWLRYEKTNAGGRLDQSVLDWIQIDAELLLFIFLPPLVFGEAMTQNIFHLRKAAGQAFLLAGPGVVIGAGLMAVLTKLILPTSYHWSWTFCLLFGSILSATDTVSVLSLLHSAAVSPKLTIVIVGESLANDGSAMILFSLFLQMLQGKGPAVLTSGELTLFLLKTLLGSPLLGAAFGYCTYLWLRTARRPLKHEDTTAQIGITIASSYLTFYAAQYICDISGVLSIVSAGLVLAWLAPPIILKPATMQVIWDFLTWFANTVIFLLSGLIIGHRVLQQVQYVDWLYLMLLYVSLNVVRATTVTCLFPWLSRWGHGCSTREALFISWAGLRGSLSMALALIVSDTCCVGVSSQETSRLFFFVGGIASLTLILNGGLARAVLDLLELASENSVENTLIFDRLQRRVAIKLERIVDSLGREMALPDSEMRDVRAAITLLRIKDERGAEANWGLDVGSMSMSFPSRQNDAAAADSRYRFPAGRAEEDALLTAAATGPVAGTGRFGNRGAMSIDRRRPTGFGLGMLLERTNTTNTSVSGGGGLSSAGSSQGSLQSLEDLNAAAIAAECEAETAADESGDKAVRATQSMDAGRLLSPRYKDSPSWSSPRDPARAMSSLGLGLGFRLGFGGGGGGGGAAAGRNSRLASRAQRMSSVVQMLRQDSIRSRGAAAPLMPELLAFVRTLFLEIVRTVYWAQIDSAKLPRTSFAVRFLLYSVDVGLDSVGEVLTASSTPTSTAGGSNTAAASRANSHPDGFDFAPILSEINSEPVVITALKALEALGLVDRLGLNCVTRTIAQHEARRNKRNVYMLSAFIEAHREAAAKLQSYLIGKLGAPPGSSSSSQAQRVSSVDSDVSNSTGATSASTPLPEALQVKKESAAVVARAQELLDAIPRKTILAVRTKQCALSALAKEALWVNSMVREGLLPHSHAEVLLHGISTDRQAIEDERVAEWRTARRGGDGVDEPLLV